MSVKDESGETMVAASCHHALQVVVESLKNRCQRYQERLKNLEKEKKKSDEVMLLTLLDNTNLRRLLYESTRDNQRLREELEHRPPSCFCQAELNGEETCVKSVHSDSSSSVEVISGSSSSSTVDTIISEEESLSTEPCRSIVETADEDEECSIEAQRALAQALENKRALRGQMEILQELGVALTRFQIKSSPQNKYDYSSLDSFEIVAHENR